MKDLSQKGVLTLQHSDRPQLSPTHSVLVTGSRSWTDAARIRHELDERLVYYGALVLIHGACPKGADAIADQWGRDHWNSVIIDRYPARWGEHGKAAGHIRNVEMVMTGPDECLAFIHDNSKGASHCANAAVRAGIPTHVIRTWGGGEASYMLIEEPYGTRRA